MKKRPKLVIKDEPPDDNWINPAEENKKECNDHCKMGEPCIHDGELRISKESNVH